MGVMMSFQSIERIKACENTFDLSFDLTFLSLNV